MATFNLLAVFAHPDDETIVAPLLAKYAALGHRVYLLTLTPGENGIREHAKIPAGDALAAVRRNELACSVAALGLTGYELLKFRDGGLFLSREIWKETSAAVRSSIERFRPDVLITWGPEGGTGHPDHRAVSSIAVQVFQQRSLLIHKPRKLYCCGFAEPVGPELRDWMPDTRVSSEFITTVVECGEYVAAARKAIECHKSQFSPDLMERVKNASGDGVVRLRLTYSTVVIERMPETDILSGL